MEDTVLYFYSITKKITTLQKKRAYSQQNNIWYEIRENRVIIQTTDNQQIGTMEQNQRHLNEL